MAAPEFVPSRALEGVRAYASPPRRPGTWRPVRPGDLDAAGQPHGDGYGNPGPDQGYALSLARRFHDKLTLGEGEHRADVVAGCLGIALKRASLFGRAPMVHDWTVALTVWGFLDADPAAELRQRRGPLFAEVAHTGHYLQRRRIADGVPGTTLRLAHAAVVERHRQGWEALLDLDALAGTPLP